MFSINKLIELYIVVYDDASPVWKETFAIRPTREPTLFNVRHKILSNWLQCIGCTRCKRFDFTTWHQWGLLGRLMEWTDLRCFHLLLQRQPSLFSRTTPPRPRKSRLGGLNFVKLHCAVDFRLNFLLVALGSLKDNPVAFLRGKACVISKGLSRYTDATQLKATELAS
jgi:hypothetical protein